MSLTGTAFLGLVLVLTVALPAVTVASWNRVGGPVVVRSLTRGGLLLLSQLMVCLLVVVVVNNQNQFYTSWGQLFGQSDHLTSSTGHLGALAPSLQHDDVGPGVAAHSEIVPVSVPVAGRRTSIPASVYLPAEYFEPSYAHRQFPVLEVLDGFPGSPQSWTHTQSLDIEGTLDSEFAAGRAQPFVAVMPEQNFQGAHDGECVNAVGGTQVETTLVSDVRTVMYHDFRVGRASNEWSVMGYSTGGYCAVNIAMRHAAMFSSAVALDGYVQPYVDGTTGPIFGSGTADLHANDPLWQAQHGNDPDVSVLLAFCDGDPQPHAQAVQFARAARSPLTVDLLHVPGGAHNFPTFRSEEPVAVDWISSHLSYSLAPRVGVLGHVPYSLGHGSGTTARHG